MTISNWNIIEASSICLMLHNIIIDGVMAYQLISATDQIFFPDMTEWKFKNKIN